MTAITTRIYTTLFGEFAGQDVFGNRYYRRAGKAHGSSTDKRAKEKRWVLYNGKAEPSKVPAEWHGWLHYTIEKTPEQRRVKHYAWEKQHLPNLTGTKGAYAPPGHLLKGGQREASTSDYEAWKP